MFKSILVAISIKILGFFLVGISPALGIYFSKEKSRFELIFGGLMMIFITAFMATIFEELINLTNSIKTVPGFESLSEEETKVFNTFKQYLILVSVFTTMLIGGTGINFFSSGIIAPRAIKSSKDKSIFLKFIEEPFNKKRQIALFGYLLVVLLLFYFFYIFGK